MARRSIPAELKRSLLYDSQYRCCVCQKRGCQIHHIDQDHSNNSEANLIVLCTTHHDEAHTTRTMSQNLDERALRHAKRQWTDQVRAARSLAATASGQEQSVADEWLSLGVAWGYINHKRIAQMTRLENLSTKGEGRLQYCIEKQIVDDSGIIIKPAQVRLSENYFGNSVYDWFEFGDDQRLHALYSEMVDQVSRSSNPIHLEPDSWTKARARELTRPGNIIFFNKGIYFKSVKETQTNDHRSAVTFKNKVRIEFFVDSIDMFGTTSMSVSFHGRQSCAALLLVKSIAENDKSELVIVCTPLALGTGFKNSQDICAN